MHLPFVLAELERLCEEDGARIRSRQKARLLREMYHRKETSHRELVHELGLRSSSVSLILEELASSGIVRELGTEPIKNRGRPRVILDLNMNSNVAISLYIEHLTLRGGVVNLEEKVLIEDEIAISQHADGTEFLTAIEKLVRTLLSHVPSGATVLGVAFSPVGAVDHESKRWINCNRWPRIDNVDLSPLETKLNLPVIIRRNLETILGYEMQTSKEYQKATVVLFHWGYGIGSAYAHEGVVLETERGNYSGIGHSLINPASQKKCQCGALGCLEAEAAIWALLPQCSAIDPRVCGEDDGTYEVLSKALLEEVPFLTEAVEAVRIGLYNLCKMLSPDYVLFLSPFSNNQKLVSYLKECVESSFPNEVEYQPEFRIVGSSFRGSLFASVYPFFRDELHRIILQP